MDGIGRRGHHAGGRAVVALALAALSLTAGPGLAAEACGPSPIGGGAGRVESPRYVVAVRPRPAPIVLGRHFALDLLVCPKDGGPPPEAVRVDAHMPAHRHGMNYIPTVTAEAGGRYRAEGLLLHMPGHWEVVIELRAAGGTERLTQEVILE